MSLMTARQVAREALGPDALGGVGYEQYLPYMERAIEADRRQRHPSRTEAALERVRAPHHPIPASDAMPDKQHCAEVTCERFYPCRTIRALAADPESDQSDGR